MTTPTLINLPPPPSTPSDFGPGTPNSFTSTVALKDGVQGSAPPIHHGHAHHGSSASTSSTNTLDAERADRISRLAGLERVATLRGASQHLPPNLHNQTQQQQPPGYFDSLSAQPHKSTVGSASATGSVGGRMTWASESDINDGVDRMSESADQDIDGVSSAGLSDEGNASLVGFGETASSTVSGPIGTGGRGTATSSAVKRQMMQNMQTTQPMGSPMEGLEDAQGDIAAQDQAQRIVGDLMDQGESKTQQPMADGGRGKGLGQFYFEGKH